MQTMYHPSGQRFILLGTARSGSNLLQNLLNSHEHISMYNELFNLDNLSSVNLTEALTDPVEYLKRRLYRNGSRGNTTIGFKMFYDHMTLDYFNKVIAPDETAPPLKKRFSDLNDHLAANFSMQYLKAKFQQAWDYLSNDSSLKIIHLKRNKLKTLVSLKIAYMTDKWMHWQPEGSAKITCSLGYEECFNYFTRISRYEEASDMKFQHHPKINISYEELVTDRQQLANKVFDFLGLSSAPVNSILKQQGSGRLEEVIENYDELKRSFSDTPWHQLFES